VAVSLYEAAERFTADVRAGKPVRSRQDQTVRQSK
jgi:chromosome condensin MukBEF MukE localization factor